MASAETRTVMPECAPSRKVGHYVTLSGSHFMIWGAEPTGSMPKGMTASLDGKWVFVANMGRPNKRTVSVYDAVPLRLARELDLEGSAIELVPSPDGKSLYLTNKKDSGYLDILDMATFARVSHLFVRGFPKFILPDSAGDHVYLSLWSGNGLARVKLPELTVETMSTKGRARYGKQGQSKNPRGMAFSPDGKTIYLANNDDRSLSFIDVATFKERKRIDVGNAPRHVVVHPDGAYAYISLTAKHRLAVLDTHTETVIRHVRVGRSPKTIDISRDGRFVYSGGFDDHSLTIVDTRTYETVDLPLNVLRVSGLAVHPSDEFIYATGWCTNDVWAVQRIDPGQQPRLPLGQHIDGKPCFQCELPPMGCPSREEQRKWKK